TMVAFLCEHFPGADVTLVTGPVSLSAPAGMRVVPVQTAEEMLSAASSAFRSCDIAVFSAAVADFRPARVRHDKIKKDGSGRLVVELVENPDVCETLSREKGERFVVAFAAETSDVLSHAREKLVSKHADLVVANDVSGALGFGTRDNRVWFVTDEGERDLGVLSKELIADAILDVAVSHRGQATEKFMD
ncbi:MAG: phosphopantothenoylcysteine decarboxylase, partial [Coriobacteriales bacterium]